MLLISIDKLYRYNNLLNSSVVKQQIQAVITKKDYDRAECVGGTKIKETCRPVI